jgi:hypothetical protein
MAPNMNSFSLKEPHLPLVLTLAAVTVGSLAFLLKKRRNNEGQRRPRAWSFTSTGLALGSFPPQIQSPEHVINAMLLFNDCPSPQAVVDQIVKRFLEYERFAIIPEPEQGTSRYCPKDLDPNRLVRHIVIKGDKELTLETLNEHLFDPVSESDDLPWWEVLIIENKGRGESACVLRIHHCLADGISMLHVVEDIITQVDGSPVEPILPVGIHKKFRVKVPFLKLLWSSLKAVVEVLTLSMTAHDDDTVFSITNKDMVHTGNRTFVMLKAIPLDFVKELKNKACVTINDIMFSVLSQTIHDFLEEQNCPVFRDRGEKLQCRALLPVGIPPSADVAQDKTRILRNKWVLASADLNVGEKDPVGRLLSAQKNLGAIKNSPLVPVQMTIQDSLIPLLPHSLGRQSVFDILSRHSVVFTNVPGPPKPVAFAGKEVTEIQMFYANLIPQVSLMSYRNQIFGNICIDSDAIPDCQSLSRLYVTSIVKLADRLGVNVPSDLKK